MNISEHFRTFFRELRNSFRAKILEFFDADSEPGSEIFLTLDPGFWMEKFGCRINIPDPKHC
jgi:hypothetical protein